MAGFINSVLQFDGSLFLSSLETSELEIGIFVWASTLEFVTSFALSFFKFTPKVGVSIFSAFRFKEAASSPGLVGTCMIVDSQVFIKETLKKTKPEFIWIHIISLSSVICEHHKQTRTHKLTSNSH